MHTDEVSSGERPSDEEVPGELSERFKALSERAKRLAGSRAGRQPAGRGAEAQPAGGPAQGQRAGRGAEGQPAGGRVDGQPAGTGDAGAVTDWPRPTTSAGWAWPSRPVTASVAVPRPIPGSARSSFRLTTVSPSPEPPLPREGPTPRSPPSRPPASRAAGATLYVTLEPCAHHGRTPPCTEAIVAAGIRRVVVGMKDPDRQVAGAGIAALTGAGLDVVVGVAADAVTEQLAPYACHRLTGRPWVVLKLAVTLDGRTAAPDGTSQWLTGVDARADAHRLRSRSDAVLVGAGTVRADDPALTVRLPPDDPDARTSGEQPLRVVLGHGPSEAKVHPALELEGDLGEVLDVLGRRGVIQLLVEGGPSVAHAFHAAGLVDRYVIYLAPALFGGDDALPVFAGPGAPTLSALWRGSVQSVTSLGGDLRVELSSRQHPGQGRQNAEQGLKNPEEER